MIKQDEINLVANALQVLTFRDELVVCVVLLDVTDGSLVATAPLEVNMPAVLKAAADRYNERSPDASGLIAPPTPKN